MTPSRWVSSGIVVIALFFAVTSGDSATVWAQSPESTSPIQLIPRTKEERERRYQAEHRIVLNLQVTDSSGKPVAGLKPEDLELLDNQKPQMIATFREVNGQTSTADVHLFFVLDAINDGGAAIGHARKDLDKYLSQGQGPLPFPISLVFVSSAGQTVTPPSTDRAVVADQLAKFARLPRDSDCDQARYTDGSRMGGQGLGSHSYGNSVEERADCMISHFTESVNALGTLITEQKNVRGRAILIWTGPGWPVLADFGTQAVGQRGNYRDVLVELNTNLREAQVTLDALSWGGFETPKNVRKPIVSATTSVPSTVDELAETTLALPALARQNGGQAISNVKNFAGAMAACLADAGDFYMLSFDSTPAATTDEFHSIEVKIDRPGMNVRTVTGYYAQP
jgi:VWFA-related protein